MRRNLTKIGNSWGLILPKELLEILGASKEVELEIAGGTMLLSAPSADSADREAALAYLASRRGRTEVYQRLAE